jgi:hypothetical protein
MIRDMPSRLGGRISSTRITPLQLCLVQKGGPRAGLQEAGARMAEGIILMIVGKCFTTVTD